MLNSLFLLNFFHLFKPIFNEDIHSVIYSAINLAITQGVVCSSYQTKILQTGWLNNRQFIFHNLGNYVSE